MDLLFSKHAVDRMSERQISTDEVYSILIKPDGKIKQTRDKWILFKNFPYRSDNFIAAVVVEMSQAKWEVITVMVHFKVINENHT